MLDTFFHRLGMVVFFVLCALAVCVAFWAAISFVYDLLVGYRVRLVSPREQELIDQNRKEASEYKAAEPEVQQ